MEIKVLGIVTDCVSLFTKEHEEFIGYVGKNMVADMFSFKL
jgi:hypothetical protein